ncbi:MAG TPA: ATP-binding protein, partial [Chitinispirillaceae bacterium]|nr:ATP-binding protein [Chitinispirillaceae bacterium]
AELERSLVIQEEMQTYLDSILQSMDNGVIGIDICGKITHFNRAASEISGYNYDNLMGRKYTRFFSSNTDGEPALVQALNRGIELKRNEKVIWHKDGHPVPVSYQTALLKDKKGRKLGAVEIFSDISRIKALEEEMQQTRTMAALGEMSATVAHEIRNPLGAMGMWAGLLERDLEQDDSRRKTLGKIIEGLSRLNKIVSNLLVYTRPVKAQFRKIQLEAILEEIVDFVQIEIERLGSTVQVKKEWTNESVCVLADPEKIGQIVMNLCLNAVQAMDNDGVLTVSVENQNHEKTGFISFSVSDTGNGIGSDVVTKMFDPFFTTKENGTGLGLAIVKKFVEFHSGYIDVKSSAQKGTTARVFLPVLKE